MKSLVQIRVAQIEASWVWGEVGIWPKCWILSSHPSWADTPMGLPYPASPCPVLPSLHPPHFFQPCPCQLNFACTSPTLAIKSGAEAGFDFYRLAKLLAQAQPSPSTFATLLGQCKGFGPSASQDCASITESHSL